MLFVVSVQYGIRSRLSSQMQQLKFNLRRGMLCRILIDLLKETVSKCTMCLIQAVLNGDAHASYCAVVFIFCFSVLKYFCVIYVEVYTDITIQQYIATFLFTILHRYICLCINRFIYLFIYLFV